MSGSMERLREAVLAAAADVRGAEEDAFAATIERPPRAEFGDYSTNAAMLLAPSLGAAPRDVAARLSEPLGSRLGGVLERTEVAGPGFLNLFLADEWFRAGLSEIREPAQSFGAIAVPPSERQRILIEFVSANPTGPLTAAGGRHAAFGDSLARLLEFVGHQVEREYYVNDYGTQVELFGKSIAARMHGQQPPEGGYGGEYVNELAQELAEEGLDAADAEALARRGVELVLDQVRATLARYRVEMDRFFNESTLHDTDHVNAALAQLGNSNDVYESEGALWLRTSAYGDEKDRVLRRSNGDLTYFAADIAYHQDKRARGYDHLIDVWGADHHGYVPRMKAAFAALDDAERVEPIIMQLVHIVERGERARMSKRKGDFVTLDELIDDIGVDATRFFMLQRSHDTTIDLDLDLAREQSEKNPVYYVQYAHARISSILRNAGSDRVERSLAADLGAASTALDPVERSLIKRLMEFEPVVKEAAERRAPHGLAGYAHELALDFSAFYRDCHVLDAEPSEVEDFRLCLCECVRRGIATTLGLLGVDAPERM
jgi:arginyl-tRNA synthetase